MLIRGRWCAGFAIAVALALAVPAAASADVTIGTTMQPTGSTTNSCPTSPANQLLLSYTGIGPGGFTGPYTVPSSASPLVINQWQVNATGAASGTQLTLVVVRFNLAAPSITVVGTDTETLNTAALPPGGIETFTPQTPIPVQSGDLLGLYLPGTAPGLTCYWSGGSIGPAATVTGVPLSAPPMAGQPIVPTGSGVNSPTSLLNLGATLGPRTSDAGVSLSAGPSGAVVGQPAVLTATLTDHGPQPGPITFTDPVPNGLTVLAASIASGTCSTNTGVGIVTCTSNSVAVGQSTTVVIVVAPTAAQTYADSGVVSLPDGGIDPNPANNSATTTLNVSARGAPTRCAVPKLRGAPVALAKRVLGLLGCEVGKTRKAHSKSVSKGLLIGTAPGAGTYAVGRKIDLTVSSGKKKKKRK